MTGVVPSAPGKVTQPAVLLRPVDGGVGYAFGALRWWHAYQHDPTAHADGVSHWR
ncbi:MAG TPA: hypothetical protein VFX41_09090 [Actinomycetales bacterium]|nr:hypothetical protein [Actinomycetales bacterium]